LSELGLADFKINRISINLVDDALSEERNLLNPLIVKIPIQTKARTQLHNLCAPAPPRLM